MALITLVSSAARTASGTAAIDLTTLVPQAPGSSIPVVLDSRNGSDWDVSPVGNLRGAVFLLDLTAAATEVGDTCNVRLQHSVDNTTWDDFVSFTQLLGNGGAKQFFAQWTPLSATPETEMRAPADGTLAAGGVLQGPVGQYWRAKWTIVDSGTVNASFTFSVKAEMLFQ